MDLIRLVQKFIPMLTTLCQNILTKKKFLPKRLSQVKDVRVPARQRHQLIFLTGAPGRQSILPRRQARGVLRACVSVRERASPGSAINSSREPLPKYPVLVVVVPAKDSPSRGGEYKIWQSRRRQRGTKAERLSRAIRSSTADRFHWRQSSYRPLPQPLPQRSSPTTTRISTGSTTDASAVPIHPLVLLCSGLRYDHSYTLVRSSNRDFVLPASSPNRSEWR